MPLEGNDLRDLARRGRLVTYPMARLRDHRSSAQPRCPPAPPWRLPAIHPSALTGARCRGF